MFQRLIARNHILAIGGKRDVIANVNTHNAAAASDWLDSTWHDSSTGRHAPKARLNIHVTSTGKFKGASQRNLTCLPSSRCQFAHAGSDLDPSVAIVDNASLLFSVSFHSLKIRILLFSDICIRAFLYSIRARNQSNILAPSIQIQSFAVHKTVQITDTDIFVSPVFARPNHIWSLPGVEHTCFVPRRCALRYTPKMSTLHVAEPSLLVEVVKQRLDSLAGHDETFSPFLIMAVKHGRAVLQQFPECGSRFRRRRFQIAVQVPKHGSPKLIKSFRRHRPTMYIASDSPALCSICRLLTIFCR
jgi:hypothetical protein